MWNHPITIVGRGRLGSALSKALRRAGVPIIGPLGRGDDLSGAHVTLLCVPDSQVAAVAAAVPVGPIVGHCSGVLTLAALGSHEGFSMHPLLAVTRETSSFEGAGCAVNASTGRAQETCLEIVRALGMRPFQVNDEMRALYHAAAALGAGYVVAIAELAERLMQEAGVDRNCLAPLVQSAVDNWTRSGAQALTGPIARGDEATVAMHREAIARYSPESLPTWDALTAATRSLAERMKGDMNENSH